MKFTLAKPHEETAMNKLYKILCVSLLASKIYAAAEGHQELVTTPTPTTRYLFLEHTLAMLANDAMKFPFKGGLYYIEWSSTRNPNDKGALWVMGSQHNYPIQRLPRVYQWIIYNCNYFDFLHHEISKKDYVEDEGRLSEVPPKDEMEKFSSNSSWFNKLSARKIKRLREIFRIDNEISLRDIGFSSSGLIACALFENIAYGNLEDTMDFLAFRHSDKWEALESKEVRKGELRDMTDPFAALSEEDGVDAVKALLSLSSQQFAALHELIVENPDIVEFETLTRKLFLSTKQQFRMKKMFDIWAQPDTGEEMQKRNLYWWNVSFPKIFRKPGKLGFTMFGLDHEWGKYVIMARIYEAFICKKSVHGAVITNMRRFIR